MNKIKHPLIKKGIKKLRLHFVSCWFGFHKWKHVESQRYNVIRDRDNKKDGEVTLHLFTCEKCGKEKLIPSDRITCS
jgi:hypothetical protein